VQLQQQIKNATMANEQRIDKWLWAMRVYKTRTIATEECKKGRVSVGDGDGVIVKPSRTIKVGDIVNVRKPPIQYTFRVLQLAPNRLGAKLVPEYLENLTPQAQYDMLDVVRISGFVDRRKGLGRPTKREGRELSKFTSEAFENDDWLLDWDDE
jgi:ribosome-associated heat shock protein Hsp15